MFRFRTYGQQSGRTADRAIHGAPVSNEDGYILLGVLILLFLFALAMAVAAPVVAKDIQRDKEEEAVQRGKQYKRAIRMYYKKFNTYPTTIAQLEKTNNIRFLRKRYKDPVTGKDDWRIIHAGEAKVPVLGFFGQPLQGGQSSVTTGLAGNGTGGLGGGSTLSGSGLGGAGSTCDPSASSNSGNGDGACPAAPVGVLPGMGGGSIAGGVAGSAGTAGGSTLAGGTGSNGVTGFGQSAASQSSSIGSGGSTGPIVGLGLAVNKKSLVIYHKQDALNKWEFTYDPVEEQMYAGAGGIGGAQPANGSSTSPGGTSSNPFSPTTPQSPGINNPAGNGGVAGQPAGNAPAAPTNNNPF